MFVKVQDTDRNTLYSLNAATFLWYAWVKKTHWSGKKNIIIVIDRDSEIVLTVFFLLHS